MSYKIKAGHLRAALKEIELAESHGFMYCEAVFDPVGLIGIFVELGYSDLCEKAHPTDGNLDWGRFQGVVRNNEFKNGKLVPIPVRKMNG